MLRLGDNIDVDPACIVILSKAKYLYIVILDSSLSFRRVVESLLEK